MKLIAIPAGPIGTNAWLLINEDSGEAVLFDAPPQSFDVISREADSRNCSIKALVITHGHWDHMLDAHLFAAQGIRVYAHNDGKHFMEHPESMSAYAMPGLEWKGTPITQAVEHGEKLNIAGIEMEIRLAPGHCPGSIVVYISDIKAAITGDVIFEGSIGRTDLPDGSFELLKENIQNQIYTLPEKTVLCPGHGETTSVENEMKNNPFVRAGE